MERSDKRSPEPAAVDHLPSRFYDTFVLHGLRLDLIEPGRLVCSFAAVPPRLANSGNVLDGAVIATLVDDVGSAVFPSVGRTPGVSLEIGVSFFDAAFVGDEIEMEAKLVHVGEATGVSLVEFRNKKTGKLIALGRHTKYLAVSSRL